jgi:hypothetical protein
LSESSSNAPQVGFNSLSTRLVILCLTLQAASPKTPDGVYVCTPGPLAFRSIIVDNLPWFEFKKHIESYGSFELFLLIAAILFCDNLSTNSGSSEI